MSTGVQPNANIQTISFRRPTNKPAAESIAKPKNRHGGLLQDQLRRAQRAPWCPSWSAALRILLLIRVAGAMYTGIQDCDEVYNFWEPLHYLFKGYGFQTWETSPEYAIRSWAYILLHYLPVQISATLIGPEKRPAFFAVRIFLGIVSSLCEVTFYRAVVDRINYRVGRYVFFLLLFNAGMWTASTAFLPSSFAMYANTLAFAHALEPPGTENARRTLFATLAFALGAVVGWPFAIAVAIPFVFEELFISGTDKVTSATRGSWYFGRWKRMMTAAGVAVLLTVPVVALDTLFYGKLTVVPWNIVKYNVFPDSQRGPELYGTEPTSFYLANLLLNFNVIVPFALFALPALAITHRVDNKRLGERYTYADKSSPYTLLAIRLAPAYLWLAIMTSQRHKEERFLYPIYPLICFNAAVTIYLVRGWLETAFIAVTNSPYKASRSTLFSQFTLSVVAASCILSVSRIMAHWKYYHAPMSVTHALEAAEDELPRIDLSLVEEWGLRLCVGKEWHRFPGHFLVPDGVRVDWIKSEFDGMLPGHFAETGRRGGLLERVKGTRVVPKDLNDLNKEAPQLYVDVSECDYLLDLDFPLHPARSAHEPRYVADAKTWERVECQPFLDAAHSPLMTRTLWMPGEIWQRQNEYGEFCLLRHRANVDKKEKAHMVRGP
ncbi:Glycosyltransferase Family 22 protein [Trametes cinnabarina]|uniref:Mannosyltransferase n=1 Tax=Pycnoporus cinnabarinus TaxID=5643 RepID=A0A060SLR8_PYCCI|nr:Glycosyltransferase Family 22 protein [Trametes cinnabarina]